MSSARGEELLYLLKTRGPQSSQVLGAAMGMTSMGARQHLKKLEETGLVAAFERRQGVGRPRQAWRLTDKGHGRFPDRHGDLTLELIETVEALYGPEGMEKLIARRETKALTHYQAALAGVSGLRARAEVLAGLRSDEGYMARVETRDGVLYLIEDHCPICAAATACRGFCRAELKLFSEALGPGVAVEREDYLLDGGRRCAYRLSGTGPI